MKMKFLKYRDDFINNKSDLTNLMQTSSLVNEFMQNDIRFGDSYLGRLINSSIQMLKTAYKTARIPFLLKDLENHVQLMVDRIKFEQIAKDYPTLFLKASLEEIKVCCVSTLTEEEKLNILIGWDGSFEPYNPRLPNNDIPGYFEGRKIVSGNSLIQDKYEKLSEPEMRKRLERAMNKELIKSFLDTLSNFMDELRRYAYELMHPTTTTPSGLTPSGFNLDLLDILKKVVSASLVTESTSKKYFLRYENFLKENQEEKKSENLKDLQDISKKLIDELENNSGLDVKSSQNFQNLISTLKNLDSEEIEILKTNDLIDDLQKITDLEKDQKIESQPEESKPEKTTDSGVLKPETNPIQQETPTVKPTTPKETPATQPDKNKITTTPVPSFSKPTTTADMNPKVEKPKVEEPKSAKESELEEEEQEKGSEGVPNKTQPLAERNKYSKYIQLILETTIPPPPLTGASVSTTSSSTPTTTKDVESLWNTFFKEVDEVFPAKMTQDDINKLKSFTAEDINLADEMIKKPDPLLKIVRIFDTANRVYTTPVIPSGRENGEVWPLTFRRYIHASGSSSGTPKNPGPGPWIHRPLFSQWKKGVLSMMSKPEFKDVFKDISGLVERFDRNYLEFDKIYEQESGVQSKSRILTDFFIDMLKIKNQGDFDVHISNALNKYFGLKIDSSKFKANSNVKVEDLPIDKNDIKENTFVWEPLRKNSFSRDDINKYFAFPIKDLRQGSSRPHQIIFIRPLSIDGDKVSIKFTYDHQGEGDVVQNAKGKVTKSNWSCDGKNSTNNIYFGVMKNDFTNGLQIAYANVSNSVNVAFIADPIYGEPKTKNGVNFGPTNQKVQLNDGSNKLLYNARMVFFDDAKKKTEVLIPANTTLKGEHLDIKLKDLKTKGDKLYNELLKKGRDNFGWR